MARISVVIITCNRREQLRETLAHMTSLPESPPIFVADNASGDGTAAMVAREFPGVRLFRLGENLGAVARNIAVAEVATPYVA
ncbi:MAG TPA: glycosyltransferase, partial [Amycolatopsis sp.]